MAEAHEEVSVKIAHVLMKIDMKEGFEFETLPVYKDVDIDEYITIYYAFTIWC